MAKPTVDYILGNVLLHSHLLANDLKDVVISSPVNDEVLMYETASAKWKNKGIPAGITSHAALTDLAYADADHTGFEPTVTKGNLTEATSSVLTISSGTGAVIGSGTSIQVKKASAAQDGYLAQGDFSTFNSKEPALSKGNLTESTSSVLTIGSGTGAVIGSGTTIQVKKASVSQDGYLAQGDFSTFNSKEPALTKGNLTESTSNILTIGSGTGAVIGSGTTLTVTKADVSHDGYLSQGDWGTFNGKQNALSVASSSDVDTGTDNAKYVTASAISNSHNVPNVVPGIAGKIMTSDGTDWISSSPATNGTVTSVSVTTANGVSGSVANPTTTPAISLTLGAITPTSVNSLTLSQLAIKNILIGDLAGAALTGGGSNNVFIGGDVASNFTSTATTNYNTAIGQSSLNAITSGSVNTTIGAFSGLAITSGKQNTSIGENSLISNATGDANVALGYYAGAYETGSNAFYVDNQNRTNTAGDKAKALLYGTFAALAANQSLMVNGVLSTSVVGNSAGNVVTTDGTQNLSNKTFTQPVFLGTSPTVGSFAEGKLYYDTTYKTASLNIDTDVNLQIGQETLIRAINAGGTTINNGEAVYLSGASGVFPTVLKAQANSDTTSFVAGVATQNILAGQEGFITARGIVHDLNTNSWTAGDNLYLSDTVAGGLQNTIPAAPGIEARVGRVVVKDASAGSIYVNPTGLRRLTDLSDVTITTPAVDQILKYNGAEWVNGAPATSSASAGIEFFNATPNITATGTNNDIAINTLSKTPITTAEQTSTISMTSNTVAGVAWLYDTALGRTSIDAGVWDFDTYAAVNTVAAGRVTTVTRQVYSVLPTTGGVTVTTSNLGVGTRTATASGGTPFAVTKIDASATNTTASYLQTPQGLYQITARTSDTVVTIAVPTTYANENGVTFNVWKKLFGSTSPTITATGTNYSLFAHTSTQSAFTITTAHKLGSITFGTSNNTTTVTLTYNGTLHNTHFQTPLITLHGNLAGLQGGTGSVPTEEYYHLTAAQHTVATNTSGTNSGDVTLATDSGLGLAGQVLNMGTPSTVTSTSTNSVTTNTHTHALTGFVPFAWTAITADQTAAVNNGYIINKAGLLLLALPAVSAVGNVIEIAGQTSQWAVTQAATQYIVFGNKTSTVGVTGSLSNTLAGDCATMVCIEANKGWMVTSSVGNLVVT